MTQQYGTVKVDFITFTSGTTGNETDVTLTVSGLSAFSDSGMTITGDITARNVTATGTLSGATITGGILNATSITGVTGVFTTLLSGASITGELISGTSGIFTNVTGTTINSVTGSFTTGTFSNLGVTGTITGDTVDFGIGAFATSTSTTGYFPDTSGTSAVGSVAFPFASGVFTNLTVNDTLTATLTNGLFGSGTESAPSIAFVDDVDTGIYSPAANKFAVSTSGTGRLIIDNIGNVGIGTTSPSQKLVVNSITIDSGNVNDAARGTVHLQNTTGTPAQNALGNAISFSRLGSGRRKAMIASVQTGTNANQTGLAFYTYNGTTTSLDTVTENLRLTSDGNVGIGTTSPDELLEVAGNIKLANTSTQLIFEDTDSTNDSINRFVSYDGALIAEVDPNNNGSVASTFRISIDNSEKLRIINSGNVGIGTTTPGEKLTVNGGIEFATANRIYSGSSSRGNIQISSPNEATNRSVSYGNNYYINTSGNWVQGATNVGGSALELRANNANYGVILFRQKQDPDSGGAERIPFLINESGKVGIGTSTPAEALEVAGNAILDASNANLKIKAGVTGTTGAVNFTFNTDSTLYAGLDLEYDTRASVGLRLFSLYPITFESANSNSPIIFKQGSSDERARIGSSGNVGIGASSPGSKLEVKGDSSNSRLHINNTSSGASSFNGGGPGLLLTSAGMNTTSRFTPGILFGSTDSQFTTTNPKVLAAINGVAAQTYSTDTAGAMELAFYTTPANQSTGNDVQERLRIDLDGNVGIGTTNPAAKLEVKGSANTEIRITDTAGGYGQLVYNESASVSAFTIGSDPGNSSTATSDMRFSVDGSEAMRIKSGGNVGIGTTNPGDKLEVNGTAAADNFKETVFTITWSSGFALNPGNGETQFVVLGGNSTPTQSNWDNGESITLHIDDGSSRTITWTTLGVVWTGGSAPTLATSGDTVVQLWKAGNVIYGALVGEVA